MSIKSTIVSRRGVIAGALAGVGALTAAAPAPAEADESSIDPREGWEEREFGPYRMKVWHQLEKFGLDPSDFDIELTYIPATLAYSTVVQTKELYDGSRFYSAIRVTPGQELHTELALAQAQVMARSIEWHERGER